MTLLNHNKVKILLSINDTISGTLDLKELIQQLADIISESFGFPRVAIDLTERSGEIVISAVHGYPGELVGRPVDLLAFNPDFARLLTGEVLIIDYDDPSLPPASRKALDEVNALRLLNVPIMRAGRLLGIIVADEPGVKRTFTEDEMRLLSAIANQVALAVENSHYYEEQHEAATEIRESRKQVLDILESINDAFFAMDNDWRFTYVNTKAAELIGKPKEELLFRNMWEAVPWLAGSIFEIEYRKAKTEMRPVSFEAPFLPPSRWLEVRVYPYENGISVYIADITERKQAEEALEESERRFREILEEVSLVAVMLDTQGNITYVNEFLLTLTGWTRDEVISRDWFDVFIPADQREKLRQGFFDSLAAGAIFPHNENDILTRNGHQRTVFFSNIVLRDSQGKIAGTTSIGEDITDRKHAEQEQAKLREDARKIDEQRRFYASILENVPIPISYFDEHLIIRQVNKAAAAAFGYPAERILGYPLAAVARENPQLYEAAKRVLETGKPDQHMLTFTTPGQTHKTYYVSAFMPDIDANGHIRGVFAEGFDVSELIHNYHYSETTLRKQLESILNSLTDGITIFDLQGNVLTMNPAALRLYDLPNAETAQMSYEAYMGLFESQLPDGTPLPPKQRPISRVLHGETVSDFKMQVCRKDTGKTFLGSYNGSLVFDVEGEPILAVVAVRDITESQRIFEELRKSETRFRATLEQAAVGIAQVGIDDRWIRVNKKLCDILGYSKDELAKLTFRQVTYPADLDVDVDYMDRLLSGELSTFTIEKRYIRKDGSLIWANLTVSLVRDPQGKPHYFISVVEDISERKRAEQERDRLLDALNGWIQLTDVAMSGLNLDDLLNSLMNRLKDIMRADAATVLLKEDGVLRIYASVGVEEEARNRITIPIGQGFAGTIAATKRPLYLRDAKARPLAVSPIIRALDIHTMLGVPMMRDDNLVGVLHVDWLTIQPEDDRELHLLKIAADRCAIAIEYAQLYTRMQEELARTRLLQDVAVAATANPDLSIAANEILKAINTHLRLKAGDIRVVDQENQVIRLVASFGFPEATVELIREVPIGAANLIATRAVREQRIITDKDDELTPERVNILGQAGMANDRYVSAPIDYRDEVAGILTLVFEGKRDFTQDELDLFHAITHIIGQAIENSRLYVAERRVADTLQDALLTIPEKLDHLEYGHLYRSATEEAKVGGDFYDLFELEHNKVGVVLGDVSGKGIEAAALTATVRDSIRAYSIEEHPVDEVMSRTNNVVARITTASSFITVFFGTLNSATGEFIYCSGGHPPAIIKRSSGIVDELLTLSPIIGAFPNLAYTQSSNTLRAGDVLILYTDGVIEARCGDTFYGEERLVSLLKSVKPAPPQQIAELIYDDVIRFTGGTLSDDLALFTISIRRAR
ncbi:MAG TPA: PAS domain S-box protein [Candidatus Aquicultor sp.]|jgi:PAS domain S-box-containing protein